MLVLQHQSSQYQITDIKVQYFCLLPPKLILTVAYNSFTFTFQSHLTSVMHPMAYFKTQKRMWYHVNFNATSGSRVGTMPLQKWIPLPWRSNIFLQTITLFVLCFFFSLPLVQTLIHLLLAQRRLQYVKNTACYMS